MIVRSPNSKRLRSQRGVNIIVLTLSMGMIVALWAAVIGLGYMSVDNIRFQNMANLAAMSAIDMYARQPSAMPTPQTDLRTNADRLRDAQASAQGVFTKSTLLSGSTSSAEVVIANGNTKPKDSSWGKIHFGKWVTFAPATGSKADGCPGENYPCFIELDPNAADIDPTSGDSRISAVRFEAKVPEQLLTAPFTKAANFLQNGNFSMEKSTTVTLVHKCTALLLDVSDLSVKDSHRYAQLANTAYSGATISSPANPGYFAFRSTTLDRINHEGGCAKYSGVDSGGDPIYEAAKLYWCNMPPDRQPRDAKGVPTGGPDLDTRDLPHAQSDYRVMETQFGRMYVDRTARYPQPLTNYFSTLNAIIRDMMRYSYQGDQTKIYAFGQTIIDTVPAAGFTENLGYLAQLTNPDNLGTYTSSGVEYSPPVYPNGFERGWFPKAEQPGSNLTLAIRRALNDLLMECPGETDKSIIAVTSGYSNWSYDADGNPQALKGYCGRPKFDPSATCGNVANTYLWSEAEQLLGTNSDEHSLWKNGILGDLTRNHVKFSAIVGSDRTQPNICNKKDSSGKFISVQDAPKWGIDPLTPSDCSEGDNIVNNSNSYPLASTTTGRAPFDSTECISNSGSGVWAGGIGPDACAWQYLGETDVNDDPTTGESQNVHFRQGLSVMAKLSYASGGQFCPLLSHKRRVRADYPPSGGPGDPPPQLYDYYRNEDTQIDAVEYLDDGNYAARCVRNAMQTSPIAIVQ